MSRVRITFHACGRKLVVEARVAAAPTRVATSMVVSEAGGLTAANRQAKPLQPPAPRVVPWRIDISLP
ncbi:hypothetical protein GCM10011504_06460 [Siccirubricoccus deserti]|nr:hypothetical protein GCM10011504_06460 [Siccirubricoccus deserti]